MKQVFRNRCAAFIYVGVSFLLLHVPKGNGQEDSGAHVTVKDTIEMTQWADRSYSTGGPSKGKVAIFSPDHSRFLVVLKKGNIEANTNDYSLLLFNTTSVFNVPRPQTLLTMSSSSNRPAIDRVKWLDDNETVTFLGENPAESPQVYALNTKNKKFTRLTSHPGTIMAYDIDSRGSQLIFEAYPSHAKKIDTPKTRRNGIVITGGYPDDILTSDCNTERNAGSEELYEQRPGGTPTLIKTADFLSDWEPMSISPNGQYALLSVYLKEVPQRWSEYEDPFLRRYIIETHNAGLYSAVRQYMVVDLDTKEIHPLIDAPVSLNTMGYAWVDDGRSIVVSGSFLPLDIGDPAQREERRKSPYVVEVLLPNKRYLPITNRLLTVNTWSKPRTELLLQSPNEPEISFSYEKHGLSWRPTVAEGQEQRSLMDVVLEEDLNTAPALYVVDVASRKKALLLDLNPQFHHISFGKVEEIRWTATDGHEVVGGLYLPPDYQPGVRYPLVIQTHGFDRNRFWIDGPFSSAFAAQPLAAMGIVVVQVGGAARIDGRTFTNTPEEGPREMAAYEGAIDYLDQRGLIDRSRVGIIGFSRTVFKVGYTLTHSRYSFAAATLADGFDGGYVDYVLFQGADAVGVNGGVPSDAAVGLWLKNAPGFNLDRVAAPIRIEEYAYSSLLGGWEWLSGLSFRDKPVELIWIPYGTHLLVKPWERLVSQQGNVDWFAFWLLGESDPDPQKTEQYQRWEEYRKRSEATTRVSSP